jgi:hypothetical protein
MISIAYSTLEEIAEICRLDTLVFSEMWDIPLLEYQTAWLHNKEIYRYIKDDDKIVGYHFVAPFPQEIFDQILSGQLAERFALPLIYNYEDIKEVCLYVYAIVVDIALEKNKEYSKMLVQDLVEIIDKLEARQIEVKDFGFMAITDAGIRLAERMGLTYIEELESDEEPKPKVFRSQPKNFKTNSIFHRNQLSK